MCAGVLRGKAGILTGFVPLIVYGVLAGSSASGVVIALGAAILVTILVCFSDLRRRMILAWASLALFAGAFMAIGVLGMTVIIPWMGVIIYSVLAAAAIGSILLRRPFTLQYAQGMVDPSIWENPGFISVNYWMTGVWGAVFCINLVLSYLAVALHGIIGSIAPTLTIGVLVAGIVYTMWYPGYIQKKHAARAAIRENTLSEKAE